MPASCRRPASDYVGGDPRHRSARLGALIDNVLDLTQSDSGQPAARRGRGRSRRLVRARPPRRARARPSARASTSSSRSIRAVGIVTGDTPPARARRSTHCSTTRSPIRDEGGRVLLHADGDAREARIVVSDNGRGMAPADQARASSTASTAPSTAAATRTRRGRPRPAARAAVRRGAWRHDRAESRAGRGHDGDDPPAAHRRQQAAFGEARRAADRLATPRRPRRSAARSRRRCGRRRRRAVRARSARARRRWRAACSRRSGYRGRGRRARPSRSSSPMTPPRCGCRSGMSISTGSRIRPRSTSSASTRRASDAALLIEWPERLRAALWPEALRLTLDDAPEGGARA